jgi:hypothetical protein
MQLPAGRVMFMKGLDEFQVTVKKELKHQTGPIYLNERGAM